MDRAASSPDGSADQRAGPPPAVDRGGSSAEVPGQAAVSVIYVSWNTREELKASIWRLVERPAGTRPVASAPHPDLADQASAPPAEDIEVVVVDNASRDGTVPMLREEFPRVVVIANEDNRGFATAVNQGWRAATGRYCLLLNPDTSVSAPTVATMVSLLDAAESIGACGPRLVDETGETTASARPFPQLTLLLDRAARDHPHGEPLALPPGPWGKVTRAHWLLGACVLLRREALQGTGGLDEGYFLYGEDIDWGYRALQCGWEVGLLEDQQAVHLGGRSASQVASRLTVFRMYDGYFRFLCRAHGGLAARAVFLWWLLKAGLLALVSGVLTPLAGRWRGRRDFEATRFAFCLRHLGRPFLLCHFGRNHAPTADPGSTTWT